MATYSIQVKDIPDHTGYQSTEVNQIVITTPIADTNHYTGSTYTTYTYGDTWSILQYGFIAFEGDISGDLAGTSGLEYNMRWNGSAFEPWQQNVVYPTIFYNSQYNVTIIQCPTSNSMWYDGSGGAAITDWEMLNGTINDFAQAARAYFDIPAVPTFTAKAYIKDLPMVTIQWDNLQNIPAGMYPASYYIKILVQDINHTYSPGSVVLVPWKVGEYKSDYRDMLNTLYNEAREQALNDGVFQIKVYLGYIDPDLGTPDHFNAVNFVLLSLDLSTGEISEDDPGTGNTVEIHNDDTPLSDDTYDDGTGSTDTETGALDLSVDNLLTSSYKVSTTQLQSIGNFLWQNNLVGQLYENQVAPIENIISCKRLPFDVAAEAANATIYLGNVATPVTDAHRTDATHKFTAVSNYTFPVYCHNFLDFATTFSIYLPYCGIHSIPTSMCYTQSLDANGLPVLSGNTLSVEYVYDILYGSCAAEVKINGATIAVFPGMCGVDIPLTQSSRANSQLAMDRAGQNMAAGITSSLLNAGLSAVASGGMGGAVMSGAKAGIDIYTKTAANQIEKTHQQLHYTTSGGFSSQIASYLNSKVVIIAEHALYTEPSTYDHENGYPCNLSLYLGNLRGYTELDGSIEISGIQCYDEERELLKQALTEGFYLQEDPDPTLP